MSSLRKFITIVQRLTEAADLDRSHKARLQRASDAGFDTEDPHYFGTPNGDFEELDLDRTSDENLAYGRGAYTSRDPEAASGYSKPGTSWGNDNDDDPTPTVYKVFLKVKNPFDLDKVYPFPEVKRILTHCFTEDELSGMELWTDLMADAYPDDGGFCYQEIEDTNEAIWLNDSETSHEDVDPDDYEDGKKDPEYISDLDAALAYDKKWLEKKLAQLEKRRDEEYATHQKMLEIGRTASAYGRDIYKTLWTNTPEYHDWRSECQLFGGDTGAFEFKTEANRWLEELGYDGIRHTDQYNPGKKGKPHIVTIAFHPNQVRSVHANFDPDFGDSPKLSEGDA